MTSYPSATHINIAGREKQTNNEGRKKRKTAGKKERILSTISTSLKPQIGIFVSNFEIRITGDWPSHSQRQFLLSLLRAVA
jgi:hypothetical protein